MNKRIIALLLVLSMAFSMVSCGSSKKEENQTPEIKIADVTSFLNKIEDLQVKNSEAVIDIDAAGQFIEKSGQESIKLSIKASSYMEGTDKSETELSYKLGDSNEYKKLTTVIIAGKTLYVDFASLKTAGVDICNVYNISTGAAVISILPQANYIKLDESTLNLLFKKMDLEEIEVPSFDQSAKKEDEKVILAAMEYVFKTVQEAVKDVTPELISGSDSELKVSMTKENLSAICDAILALDLEAKYDEMIQKMTEAGNADKFTKDLVKEKAKTISEIKKELNDMKTQKDNFTVFNVTAETKADGEKGARKVSMKASCDIQDENNKIAMSIDVQNNEQAVEGKTVTAPADAVDLVEYLQQLSSYMQ